MHAKQGSSYGSIRVKSSLHHNENDWFCFWARRTVKVWSQFGQRKRKNEGEEEKKWAFCSHFPLSPIEWKLWTLFRFVLSMDWEANWNYINRREARKPWQQCRKSSMTCKDQKLHITHLFKKKKQKILHKIINKVHSKSCRLHWWLL